MELENKVESVGMDMEARNEMLRTHRDLILSDPTFAVGDLVKPNALGIISKLFEDREQLLVTRVGETVGKWCGDYTRTVEMWAFTAEGELKRIVTDPKFIERV